MYTLLFNEKTKEVVESAINYINTTKLETSYIDTIDLCHLLGYIKHLESKLNDLEENKDMLKVYNTVLNYKIKDIEKILER